MKKIFSASSILVMLSLIFSIVALPADALTGPKDSCKIGRDISITIPILATLGTNIVTIESKTILGNNTVISAIESDITGEVTTRSTVVTLKDVPITAIHQAVIVDKWGSICLINAVNNVVDWIFLFLLVISVAMIAIAGFLWMTSGSDTKRVELAKNMIIAALVGLVIAILARILPAVVLSVLG